MDPDVVARPPISDEPYLTSDEDEDEVGHEASPTETDELIDNATTTENGASGKVWQLIFNQDQLFLKRRPCVVWFVDFFEEIEILLS